MLQLSEKLYVILQFFTQEKVLKKLKLSTVFFVFHHQQQLIREIFRELTQLNFFKLIFLSIVQSIIQELYKLFRMISPELTDEFFSHGLP